MEYVFYHSYNGNKYFSNSAKKELSNNNLNENNNDGNKKENSFNLALQERYL